MLSVLSLTSLYLLVILLIELLTLRFGLPVSTIGYGVLLVILYNHANRTQNQSVLRLLIGISLVLLSRLFSICLPVLKKSPQFSGIAASVLILVSIIVAIRYLDLSIDDLGLSFRKLTPVQSQSSTLRSWSVQLGIALSGIPLGLLGGTVLHTIGLTGSFIIAFFPAILYSFTEELLYRGVLLKLGEESFPKAGIILSSVLFMLMNLVSGSLVYAFWMGLVGMAFALAAFHTRSLFGIIIAHTLMLMFLIV